MSGTVRYDGRDVNCTPGGAFTPDAHNITIATLSNAGNLNMVHEFGHAYDHLLGRQPRSNMPPWMYSVGTGRDLFLRPNPCDYCYVWQQHPPSFGSDAYGPSETFGDLFIAWVYDAWNTSTDPQNVTAVINAQQWMNNGMSRNLWAP
jgi:hypothetical protein